MRTVSLPILAVPILCLLLGFAPAASAVTIFTATLEGSQEVPANASTASGFATLTLNDAQDSLEISIQINGLDLDGNQTPGNPDDDITLAHIHAGAAGMNGGIVFGFIGPNNDLDGDLVIDPVAGTIFSVWDGAEGNGTTLAAQLANLLAEGLYINVHTAAFGGGEIRGQIVPEPGSAGLVAAGLLALAGRRLRRRR